MDASTIGLGFVLFVYALCAAPLAALLASLWKHRLGKSLCLALRIAAYAGCSIWTGGFLVGAPAWTALAPILGSGVLAALYRRAPVDSDDARRAWLEVLAVVALTAVAGWLLDRAFRRLALLAIQEQISWHDHRIPASP